MESGSLGSWGVLLLLFSGIVYLIIIQAASEKGRRSERLTAAERLARLAGNREESEYDVFRQAAADWRVPETKCETDFKRYLTGSEIPYYVNSYIRRNEKQNSRGQGSEGPEEKR